MQLRSLALFLIATAVAGLLPCLHAAELTAKDMQMIEGKVGDNYGSGNLHASSYLFADGAKGRAIGLIADAVEVAFGPPFVDQRERDLYDFYCTAHAVVLARSIDSKGVLAPDKSMIFTVANFEVVDSLKAAPGIQVHDVVTTWSLGGDVTDAGERLRVQINDLPSFTPGQLYVLELGYAFGDTAPVLHVGKLFSVAGDEQRLQVHGYNDSGWLHGLRGGSRTYDQFRAAVLEAAALKACP